MATAAEKRSRALRAAIVSGVLLVISGTTGSTALLRLGYTLLATWLPFLEPLLFAGLIVLVVLASLGGFTVLWGAWLISRGSTARAKFLMTVGTGVGLLGLVAHVLVATFEGNDPVVTLLAIGSTTSGMAVLLSVYARAQLPKRRGKKKKGRWGALWDKWRPRW